MVFRKKTAKKKTPVDPEIGVGIDLDLDEDEVPEDEVPEDEVPEDEVPEDEVKPEKQKTKSPVKLDLLPKVTKRNADGDEVIVALKNAGNMEFNASDKSGKVHYLNLKKGEQPVDRQTFEVFESDKFFKEHILEKHVFVVSRPGKTLDSVDI